MRHSQPLFLLALSLVLSCLAVALVPGPAAASHETSDLQGTWHEHRLISSHPSGWSRMTRTINDSGYQVVNWTDSSGGSGSYQSSLTLLPDGRFVMGAQPGFHYFMTESKDVAVGVGTSTSDDTSLGVMVKQGPSYATADLAGVWEGFGLTVGTSDIWERFTLTVQPDGSASWSWENALGQSNTASGTVFIDAQGRVTFPFATDAPAHMSSSKDLMVVSHEFEGLKGLLVFMKQGGGGYTSSDLSGTWVRLGLTASSWNGWVMNTMSVEEDGSVIYQSLDSDGLTGSGSVDSLTLTASGQLSMAGVTLMSRMSTDRDLIAQVNSWGANESELALMVKLPASPVRLVFPYAASDGIWESEVGIINGQSETMSGILRGYAGDGSQAAVLQLTLPAYGRIELALGQVFGEQAGSIRYLVLETEADRQAGYIKFSNGVSRGAVPASSYFPAGNILVPHLGASGQWWTGFGLANTSASAMTKTLWFNQGSTAPIFLNGGAHTIQTLDSLLGSVPSGLETAILDAAPGLVGLELFGSGNQLAGVRLTDETATVLYYPHVAASAGLWWTGVVAYNPPGNTNELTITAYSATGSVLGTASRTLAPTAKLMETVQGLGFPQDTAWIKITAQYPISGMELFGTGDSRQLAGFSVVNFSRMSGLFPKLDKQGWTGIAFVNTLSLPITVTLTAYDDSGVQQAKTTMQLLGGVKRLGTVNSLFPAQTDLSKATYLAFSANGPVAGFQLNGSIDGWMLDALPALGVE